MIKPDDEFISISKAEYEELLEDARFLQCLQNAGVDNWDGYDYAREEFYEGEE
jgi:hypothetical protein